MVSPMRFLLAAACTVALLLAVPAFAADQTAQVGDDFFDPDPVRIAKGDTVTWDWVGVNDHSVVATPGKKQIERFKSAVQQGTDKSFAHTFENEGSFTYLCTEHADTMKGRVVVGTDDDVKPRIRRLKVTVSGDDAKVSFRLSERSVVTLKLTGEESKRSVKVKDDGKNSFKLKNLSDGDYTVKLTAKDGFGNKRSRSKEFSVG